MHVHCLPGHVATVSRPKGVAIEIVGNDDVK